MTKRKKRKGEDLPERSGSSETGPDDPQPTEAAVEAAGVDGGGEAGVSVGLVEPSGETIRRLEEELEQLKDRHLRTAAAFDNFRKRTVRDRNETWARAQAQLASSVLDALDDLSRVLELDPGQATVPDVVQGVELVERKLLRELEAAGLRRVGVEGEIFDPNDHEAVGTVPASSPEADGTVAQVLQVGYRFGDSLLRPARVMVHVSAGAENDQEEVEG